MRLKLDRRISTPGGLGMNHEIEAGWIECPPWEPGARAAFDFQMIPQGYITPTLVSTSATHRRCLLSKIKVIISVFVKEKICIFREKKTVFFFF